MAESYQILCLPGDGIGAEVTEQALRVLQHVATRSSLSLTIDHDLVGGSAFEAHGSPILPETLKKGRSADAVLLGAVGGPQWDELPHSQRPEQALLELRSGLQLFANLRPVKAIEALLESSTLKREVISGVDLMVLRELTGGIYFGKPRGEEGEGDERFAHNTLVYSVAEIRRLAERAFEIARLRRKKVTSVDKANILESSILWREVVTDVAKAFPDVTLEHLYVDNTAMQLVRDPRQFDVIVTGNMFGDILSDEAAMLTGSIGMLSSASLGSINNSKGFPLGLYEPVHGSAPDIAGQGKANPLAMILSVALMLRYSLNCPEEAEAIEQAVEAVLAQGYRTADLVTTGETALSTSDMTEQVLGALT